MKQKIHTYKTNVPYNASALNVHNGFRQKMNTMLLESVETSSKNQQSSLLITSSCLRIVASIFTVEISPLTKMVHI